MRYIFLIYSQERAGGPPKEEIEGLMKGHAGVMRDATEKGILRSVEGLKPTSAAVTVRMQEGGAMTTDGPFAETKEQLAGYYILDCSDMNEAVEWAKRIPTTCKGGAGCIEVRPVADLPRVP